MQISKYWATVLSLPQKRGQAAPQKLFFDCEKIKRKKNIARLSRFSSNPVLPGNLFTFSKNKTQKGLLGEVSISNFNKAVPIFLLNEIKR